MTGRKRSASVELTRNSVAVIEPVQPLLNNMNTVRVFISSAWKWCTSWFVVPTYTDMTYASNEIVAETHIQATDSRIDGTTSLKRLKTRRSKSTPRSKFAVNEHRKGGLGRMDISGCKTNIEARQRIDDYWRPPELGLLKKKKNPTLERTRSPASSAEYAGSDRNIRRRHSDSSEARRTPPYYSSSPKHSTRPKTPVAQSPRTPDSLPRNVPPFSGLSKKDTLEDRLKNLFSDLKVQEGLEEEQKRQFFTPSSAKDKERAERIKKREEEKRAEDLLAAKALRLTRRQPKTRLVQQLSQKWEDIVSNVQYTNSQRVITTSKMGNELRQKDFTRLLGHQAWLNDEIINTYMEWMVIAANAASVAEAEAQGELPSRVPKFIAHNSFFWTNLNKKGPGSADRLMKRQGAPGKSILEVDSIFVPICSGSHWTVGVVRPVAKTIEYFDSLGGSSKQFILVMRSWLKHQLGDAYVEGEWKEPRTTCARQTNGYDCGVFVCTNAFCVTLGLETSCYAERDMTLQRRNIAAVLINRGFVGDLMWNNGGL